MAYLIHLAILFAIYAILGMSLNLVVGYTGLLSITHAAFYGIGAYTTAILLTKTGAGFFTSLILGIFITIAVSFLVGIVLSKFKGDYYSIGTLGFNTIIGVAIVFLAGMEEGIFPHARTLMNEEEVEEERRLCYVGITRAEKQLFLSNAKMRTIYGHTVSYPPSRFLQEVPRNLVTVFKRPVLERRTINMVEAKPQKRSRDTN